jgi:uncharacterized protein YhhL (DUF1145 family)
MHGKYNVKVFISVIKTNQFILHRAEVAVFSQTNTKHMNTVWTECKIFYVKIYGTHSTQEASKG